MGKTILTEYNITSSLLKNNTRMGFFGDLHDEYAILERYVEIIKYMKILYVVISGDIIESVKGSKYSKERIVELLEELSKFATIISIYGNHDELYEEAEPEEDRERLLTDNYAFWSRIRNIDNFLIADLPDTGVTASHISLTDDIDISTINIPADYYYFHESKEEYEEYIRTLDKLRLCNEKFNILLAHSPKNIINGNNIDDYIKNIKGINLILSGHMHAGLVPYNLRNDSRRGLLGPGKSIFPSNSYGILKDGETMSLITGGATKISNGSFGAPIKEIPGVKQLLNVVYPPELEIINLNPGIDSSINKVKELRI